MEKKGRRQEAGMITVEAVLTLVPFILLVVGIISFINLFLLHNKIQYALYQAGSELSAYTYFYHALGLREADLGMKEDIDRETEEIDQTISDVSDFMDQLDAWDSSVGALSESSMGDLETNVQNLIDETGKLKDSGAQTWKSFKDLVDDPQDLLRNVVFFGIEKLEEAAKGMLLGAVAYHMVEGYLESDIPSVSASGGAAGTTITADEYLRKAGVIDGMEGLDFRNSKLFSDDEYRMIDIVVEYKVDMFFFDLLFIDPQLTVVQRCVIPAWLDGDGGENRKY